MLVVDSNSRTIFGTYEQLSVEESWNLPKKKDVRNAQVICLDPFFGKASLLVAQYAKTYNKPIVTVDCKFDDPIFLGSDYRDYLRRISQRYVPPSKDRFNNSQIQRKLQRHGDLHLRA